MSEIIKAWAVYHGFRKTGSFMTYPTWSWVSPWDPKPPFDKVRGRTYFGNNEIIKLCNQQMRNL